MIPRWLPQKPAMTAGLPWIVPRSAVDAWETDKILARKQQVLMAEEQRVDAVELGEVLARVLLPRR